MNMLTESATICAMFRTPVAPARVGMYVHG